MRSRVAHLLFGLDGRANRAEFWLLSLLAGVLLLLVAVAGFWAQHAFAGRGAGPTLATIALGIPAFLIWLLVAVCVTVRRLKDREADPRLTWLFVGAPLALSALSLLLPQDNRPSALALQSLIGTSIFGLVVWYVVVCGFLRGSYGPNAHAPDPLDPASRAIAPPASAPSPRRASLQPSVDDSAAHPAPGRGLHTVRHVLFEFEGRINRALFLIAAFGIGFLENAIIYGLAIHFGWWTSQGIDGSQARVALVLVGLALLWPTLAIIVKRLNDRDRPAWLVIAILLPNWISLLTSDVFAKIPFDSSTPRHELVLTLLTITSIAYAIIELGCLRGTIGSNRHGPDPLEARQRRTSLQA